MRTGFGAVLPKPHKLPAPTCLDRCSNSVRSRACPFPAQSWSRISSIRRVPIRQKVALPTRLVLRELQEISGDIDHAGGVIQNDQTTRAHDRSGSPQRFIIHRRVCHARREASARWSPNLHGFESASGSHAPADLLYDFAHRRAHWDFNQPTHGARCPQEQRPLSPCLKRCHIVRMLQPPSRKIHGTSARVSTLLITVGLPHNPCFTGKGGRSRGMPRFPSIEAINAVSSPHTKAPAPSLMLMASG